MPAADFRSDVDFGGFDVAGDAQRIVGRRRRARSRRAAREPETQVRSETSS